MENRPFIDLVGLRGGVQEEAPAAVDRESTEAPTN
jgi:hypothetical protein